jgi:hypothetical protein
MNTFKNTSKVEPWAKQTILRSILGIMRYETSEFGHQNSWIMLRKFQVTTYIQE